MLSCSMVLNNISVIYFLPTRKLASDIIWIGKTTEGLKYLDLFPKELVAHLNNKDMIVTYKNGSTLQFYGSDFTENVGMNANVAVFSEFFICKFSAFQLIEPIITMNNGRMILLGTIRNKNAQYNLYKRACHEAGYYVQDMDIRDTQQIPLSKIQQSINVGKINYEVALREYFNIVLDVDEARATYRTQFEIMKMEKRVSSSVTRDPELPTFAIIDFGMDDVTSIVYFQYKKKNVRMFDYDEEGSTKVRVHGENIKAKYPQIQILFTAWDANRRGIVGGETPREIFESQGFMVFPVKRDGRVEEGIERTREEFDKFEINYLCKDLLNSVKKYNYTDTSKKGHIWSHGCDNLRGLSKLLKTGILENVAERYSSVEENEEESSLQSWLRSTDPKNEGHDIGQMETYSNELGF